MVRFAFAASAAFLIFLRAAARCLAVVITAIFSSSSCGWRQLFWLRANDRRHCASSRRHAPGATTRDGTRPSGADVSALASLHASVSAKVFCRRNSSLFSVGAPPVFWSVRRSCLFRAAANSLRRAALLRDRSQSPASPKKRRVFPRECAPSLRAQIRPLAWTETCPPSHLCAPAPVSVFLA
jgi:hypothetical protein